MASEPSFVEYVVGQFDADCGVTRRMGAPADEVDRDDDETQQCYVPRRSAHS